MNLLLAVVFSMEAAFAETISCTCDSLSRLVSARYGNGQDIQYTDDEAGNGRCEAESPSRSVR
jgi:hypothetical protein